MGIPMTIFAWMNVIYGLVLFEGIYGIASLILSFPIWVDISLFAIVLILAMGLYFKLLHREKFKPNLFVALFLVPLSIPGLHTAGKLIPRVTPTDLAPPAIIKSGTHFPQRVQVVGSGYVVEFPNSHSKGRLGDSLTARRLTARGYRKEKSKVDQAHGIDGVYVRYKRNGHPKEILIVENKVDRGTLISDQMTDAWVTRNVEKMVVHSDRKVRHTGELIRKYPHLIRKELWHHDLKSGKTSVSVLDREAKTSPPRIENYLVNQIRQRCESKRPGIHCLSITE